MVHSQNIAAQSYWVELTYVEPENCEILITYPNRHDALLMINSGIMIESVAKIRAVVISDYEVEFFIDPLSDIDVITQEMIH